MVSKARLKYIKSLQVKKYRKQEQCFVVEGAKGVQELLRSDFEVTIVVGTKEFLGNGYGPGGFEVIEASARELEQLGAFQSNNAALAVARMRPNTPPKLVAGEFALVLDDIRDPGNLGTIIRTADWYGLKNVIASEETADFYNPKVIAASMGSFTRMSVYYVKLAAYFRGSDLPTFGAFLDGEDVHKVKFGNGGLIVIGNESTGISPDIEKLVKKKVTIPRYGQAESLNASIAAAVILDNLRRG